jgi:hypothetical protein
MSGGGADLIANEIAETLLDGKDFALTLPSFDGPDYEVPIKDGNFLYDPIDDISNADLTSKVVDGTGTFDYLMAAFRAHLDREYENGRITGSEYTKTYIALTEGAMSNATQFLLGKDAAHWNAIGAQLQARQAEIGVVTARVQLQAEKTKLQLLKFETLTAQVNYALTKMRLATESINFDTAKFQLDEMLPLQKTLVGKQVEQTTAEIASVTARTAQTVEETKGVVNNNDLQPQRKALLLAQIDEQSNQNSNLTKQGVLLDNEAALQPQKVDMLTKQIAGQLGQNILLGKQADNLQQEINLGPDKLALLKKQVANQEAQTLYVGKQGQVIDKELELQPYKKTLLQEQAEGQRAQTLDTRTDGIPVAGSVGKQKDLLAQQVISYKRDGEMKAARVFIDAWVTMKTIDEGLAPPTAFSNTNLDAILGTVKLNNGL